MSLEHQDIFIPEIWADHIKEALNEPLFWEQFGIAPRVYAPRSRRQRLWVKVRGWKWNLLDAWRCLRGTHYAQDYLD